MRAPASPGFFVDVQNDAPAAPVLNKPADGEELIVRHATLDAQNPVDPEGDAVTLTFEVASRPSPRLFVPTARGGAFALAGRF